MKIPPASESSSDDRLLAAMAHGSIILFTFGFIAPMAIWITQRQKSAFVTFHALQALIYQLLQTAYWVLAMIVLMFVFFVVQFGGIALMGDSPDEFFPAVMFASQGLLFLGMFCAFGLYLLPGLLGALLTLGRKDFRYPLIGKWVEGYLERDGDLPPAPAGLTHSNLDRPPATEAPEAV